MPIILKVLWGAIDLFEILMAPKDACVCECVYVPTHICIKYRINFR